MTNQTLTREDKVDHRINSTVRPIFYPPSERYTMGYCNVVLVKKKEFGKVACGESQTTTGTRLLLTIRNSNSQVG